MFAIHQNFTNNLPEEGQTTPLHTSLVCTSFGGFGGTVYIAISPGSIHDSVFFILLLLFNFLVSFLHIFVKTIITNVSRHLFNFV